MLSTVAVIALPHRALSATPAFASLASTFASSWWRTIVLLLVCIRLLLRCIPHLIGAIVGASLLIRVRCMLVDAVLVHAAALRELLLSGSSQ